MKPTDGVEVVVQIRRKGEQDKGLGLRFSDMKKGSNPVDLLRYLLHSAANEVLADDETRVDLDLSVRERSKFMPF